MSVIMATYKEKPVFLKTCIDSILNQTVKDFEFIIVVEPDETNMDFLETVGKADGRINILKNEYKLGVAGSRNRAIAESSCKYIAFIDGDDYCDRRRFEKQMGFLDNHPDVSVVGSNIYLIDENNGIIGERTYPELYRDIRKAFLFSMAIANPTVMLRKEDLNKVGGFDDKLFKAEDFDLWLRFLVNKKKMHNLQDKLVYYRTQRNLNLKRGRLHYKNYFAALNGHGRFIWPFHQRFLSLFLFYFVSHIPNFLLDILLNLKIVNKIKNINLDNSTF